MCPGWSGATPYALVRATRQAYDTRNSGCTARHAGRGGARAALADGSGAGRHGGRPPLRRGAAAATAYRAGGAHGLRRPRGLRRSRRRATPARTRSRRPAGRRSAPRISAAYASSWAASTATSYRLTAPGAAHLTFTDAPLYLPPLPSLVGSLDRTEGPRITAAAGLAFLDSTLRDAPGDPATALSGPQVRCVNSRLISRWAAPAAHMLPPYVSTSSRKGTAA